MTDGSPVTGREAMQRDPRRRSAGFAVLVILVLLVCAGVAAWFGLTAPSKATEARDALPATPTVNFHAPGGNTTCRLDKTGAICELTEHVWPAPAAPSECPEKWGNRLQIMGEEPAPAFVCATEALPGGVGVELPYGQNLTRGDFTCQSKEAAIRCLNVKTQRGFSISKTDYTPF